MVQTRGVTEKALSVRSICYCFHDVNRLAIFYVVYFIILNNILLFEYYKRNRQTISVGTHWMWDRMGLLFLADQIVYHSWLIWCFKKQP